MLISLLFFLLQADPIINEDEWENEALMSMGLVIIFVFVLFVILILILKFVFGGKKETIKEVHHIKEVQTTTSNPPIHRTHCGQCGAKLDKDTPFCPYCGAQF